MWRMLNKSKGVSTYTYREPTQCLLRHAYNTQKGIYTTKGREIITIAVKYIL